MNNYLRVLFVVPFILCGVLLTSCNKLDAGFKNITDAKFLYTVTETRPIFRGAINQRVSYWRIFSIDGKYCDVMFHISDKQKDIVGKNVSCSWKKKSPKDIIL